MGIGDSLAMRIQDLASGRAPGVGMSSTRAWPRSVATMRPGRRRGSDWEYTYSPTSSSSTWHNAG